jgi:hypothetical protein
MRQIFLTAAFIFATTSAYSAPQPVENREQTIEQIRAQIRELNREDFECKEKHHPMSATTSIAAADHNIAVSNRTSLDESGNNRYFFTAEFANTGRTAYVLIVMNDEQQIIEVQNTVTETVSNQPLSYLSDVRCKLK